MSTKKLSAMLAVMAFAVVPLAACGDSVAPKPETAKTAEAPADLKGNWKSDNSSDSANFTAEITGNTITVHLVNAEQKTKALYWAGTYQAPTAPGDYTWGSKNDTAQTSTSIVGSPDPTKKFAYNKANGTLAFDFSAMGVTKTVEMKRS